MGTTELVLDLSDGPKAKVYLVTKRRVDFENLMAH